MSVVRETFESEKLYRALTLLVVFVVKELGHCVLVLAGAER